MNIHAGKYTQSDTFRIEKILDCEGPFLVRKYLIKWKGYSSEYNTWEPGGNLHPADIAVFEKLTDCSTSSGDIVVQSVSSQ